MNREDIIKLAKQVKKEGFAYPMLTPEVTRLIDLIISHKLDEIANKLQQDFKGAFGADTCASWATWLRSQK